MSPKPIYDDLAHLARRRSSAKYRAAHRDLVKERARLYWQRKRAAARAAAHDIVDDCVLPLAQRKQQWQHPNPPPPPHSEQQQKVAPVAGATPSQTIFFVDDSPASPPVILLDTPPPSPSPKRVPPVVLTDMPPDLNSTKEKAIGDSLGKALVQEVMGFQEDEMSPLRNADKGIHIPSIVGSSVTTNMYVLPKGSDTSTFLSPSFYTCGVGDYIRMGIDFYDHIPNEQYDTIHAFFSSLDKQGVTCTRKKKTLAWAVHFVLLDLPMGSQVASDGLPSWNVVTEDHVHHGLGVAGACLDDMGWIVWISSILGDSPSWVEKYVPKSELEIVYRFTVEDVEHKGFVAHRGFSFKMDAFYMFVLRRMGSFTTPHKDSGNVLFSRHVLHHYLPESTCIIEAGGEIICRAGVQRSVGFIQGLLEALCIPRGLALEMGSGIAPLMRACMATGRPCFSFDNDEHVIATIVRPLVARGPSIGHKVSCGEVGDDSDYFEDAYSDLWTSD